jgi:hypothetical protein
MGWTLATGALTLALFSQQGWFCIPMWQSPAIFLQQAISACVMVEAGRQASAGVAVQTKIRMNANAGRHFAMTRCYILNGALVKRFSGGWG